MKYTGIIERPNTITIDGYSNAKTIKGAISEMGRYIKKHISESEGNAIIDAKEEAIYNPCNETNSYIFTNDPNNYFFTIEEVPCASTLNEDTDEIEYSEGRFYMVVRIVK